MHKILVVGASGFLGSAICKHAIERGFAVVGLSRRGRPNGLNAGWADKVFWKIGDVFDPSTYADELTTSTSIVHSTGILLENGYKEFLNGSKGIKDIGGRVLHIFRGGENPLTSQTPQPENTPSSSSTMTYERMNRDSCKILFDAIPKPNKVSSFVYISAEDLYPLIIPRRYISTKRDAEAYIIEKTQGDVIRPLIIRPGLMYAESRPILTPLVKVMQITNAVTSSLPSTLQYFVKGLPLVGRGLSTAPLHTDVVARAIVNSIEDSNVAGVFSVDDIQHLAT